ncbi:MAG: cell envelope integrity protein CreD [Muribaculaceae bacterium]|nr:cell envelope integrity protein CreD [Muribaculaceae bacterium]
MSYASKVLMLGLQCVVLMVGALAIWLISYSREDLNNDVAEDIAGEWGRAVYISGPTVRSYPDSAIVCTPEIFNCEATVDTKSLHRNIYETEVFNARVSLSGTFCKDSILATAGDSILVIELKLKTKQIATLSPLDFGGKTLRWKKTPESIFAEVPANDIPATIHYSTDFDIHGSAALFIKQIGDKSAITIDGEAPNPSFKGSGLPDERSVRGRTFSARWERSGASSGSVYKDETGFVGTNFLVGVDRYQKVARSLKYAFMIIVLTYMSVLFIEIGMKCNIPLLNYLLIGVALIIFYILLLSFCERMAFGLAYLIASAMTVGLISAYIWKMLVSPKAGIGISLILISLYAGCYILLTLSTYALLLGSIILFFALAAMMYGSLHINQEAASN